MQGLKQFITLSCNDNLHCVHILLMHFDNSQQVTTAYMCSIRCLSSTSVPVKYFSLNFA